MKKSKILILAALAAATAMVSSCSDNGDLSTPTKEAEGKALVVNPTVLDSRVTPLAKGAFKGFKLYGVQNPNILNQSVGSFIKTGATNGVDYSGAFGETAADVAFTSTTAVKWPTEYPSNSANFYAFSVQGGSDLTGSGITVNEDVNGWPNGTFSYTAPVDGDGNVDLSAQKDIMIASSIEAKQTDNGGVVTLPFKHAFAKLTLQLRWNSEEYLIDGPGSPANAIEDGAILVVDYIKFHNIKCNGTYDFTADDGNGGKGKWTVDGENSTIMFKYDKPKHFTAKKYTYLNEYLDAHPGSVKTDQDVMDACKANPFEVQDFLVGNDAMMIIPQKLGVWSGSNFSSETSGAFIEIHGLAYNITDAMDEFGSDYVSNTEFWEDFLDEKIYVSIFSSNDKNVKNMMSVYFPIRIDSSTPFVFEANKSYNFRLNVATCRQDNGGPAIEGVELND